jgi:hypothetical protein
MRKLKTLKDFKIGKVTAVENGVERPATEEDTSPIQEAFRIALAQGNVTVNGKPIS